MGVLACDRAGCENIMCDLVSYKHSSYICYECLNELRQFLLNVSVSEFDNAVEAFMKMEKAADTLRAVQVEAVDNYLKQTFVERK